MILNSETALPDYFAPLIDEQRLEIVWRYCYLATKDSLTDSEADQLELILKQAEYDGCLDFWIQEVDHFLDHELGLRAGNTIYPYENEEKKAILREYLKNHRINLEANDTEVQDLMAELEEDFQAGAQLVQQLQSQLKRQGYNPGNIDGVMGPKTQTALAQFQGANNLVASGIPDSATQSALGLY